MATTEAAAAAAANGGAAPTAHEAAAAPAAADAAMLSRDEATVYDRQLRVWGVEVQKKLTAARVLIVGFGKLAAEVAKNATLAGVGAVTLLDDAPASDHQGASFLVPSPAPENATVAEVAAGVLQAMNPLVRVAAAPGSPNAAFADPAALASYDLIVATRLPLSALAAANAAARAAGAKFIAADARGPAAFYFSDLGDAHAYAPKADAGAGAGASAAAAAAASSSSSARDDRRVVLRYAPLADALAAGAAASWPPNVHALVPALAAAAAAERAAGGRPLAPGDASPGAPAAVELERLIAAASAAGAAAPPAWADDAREALRRWADAGPREFAPVAAVVGGVIGNDVVRAVSGSDAPTHNVFCYSLSGRPMVHVLPPSLAAAGVGGAAGAAAAAAKGDAGGKGKGKAPQQQQAGNDDVAVVVD